jgi:hypothetical protein
MQHLAIGEFLNVQYKRALLNNLRRKYKILGSESEIAFERQFLNLSAFYNSLPVKEPDTKGRAQPAPDVVGRMGNPLPAEDNSDS